MQLEVLELHFLTYITYLLYYNESAKDYVTRITYIMTTVSMILVEQHDDSKDKNRKHIGRFNRQQVIR